LSGRNLNLLGDLLGQMKLSPSDANYDDVQYDNDWEQCHRIIVKGFQTDERKLYSPKTIKLASATDVKGIPGVLTIKLITPTTTIPTSYDMPDPDARLSVWPPRIAFTAKNPNMVKQLHNAGSSAG
jgi:hypothetical protein